MSNLDENANVIDEFEKMLAETEANVEKLQVKEDKPVNYIMLVKPLSKILVKGHEIYDKDARLDTFYCSKASNAFKYAEKLKVVPVAFLQNYVEMLIEGKQKSYFGKWRGDEVKALAKAGKIQLDEGSFYNYALPNGHILMPVEWVCVHLVDYPEIDDAIIAYKNFGTKIWKDWKKDTEVRAKASATLMYEIESTPQDNGKGGDAWTDIGFTYVENLAETNRPLAVECMKQTNQVVKAYASGSLITNKAVALQAPKTQKIEAEMLPDATDAEMSDAMFDADESNGSIGDIITF